MHSLWSLKQHVFLFWLFNLCIEMLIYHFVSLYPSCTQDIWPWRYHIQLNQPGIPGVTYVFVLTWFVHGQWRYLSRRRCPWRQTFVHVITFKQLFFWQDWWPWPIDYLIRFWSIFVVTLTLTFQGQTWNLLYFSQKWSDCHEIKSKRINWTLGLKCDHWVWPRYDIDLELKWKMNISIED